MSWLRPVDQWFADRVFALNAKHRAYARKLVKDPEEAEDLVQEAYARLFSMDDWARIGNPHAFTMRIIHNEAMERYRRARVVQLDHGVSLQALDPADDRPLPDEAAFARAELARVEQALDTLPERCRMAVRLRKIDCLSPQEVAARMDISVSTVEKHLIKGLRLLFSRISRQGDSEDTGPPPQCRPMRRNGMK